MMFFEFVIFDSAIGVSDKIIAIPHNADKIFFRMAEFSSPISYYKLYLLDGVFNAFSQLAVGAGLEPASHFRGPSFSAQGGPAHGLARPESSGRGGIRTHDAISDIAVFKTAALNRSATLPLDPRLFFK